MDNNANMTDNEKYEKLVLMREALLKESRIYMVMYIREFGNLMCDIVRTEADFEYAKRCIEYCRDCANNRKLPNLTDMDHIAATAKDFYDKQLVRMTGDIEDAKKTRLATESELLQSDIAYKGIARLIHPQLHPELHKSEEIKKLWTKVSIAYIISNTKALEKLAAIIRDNLNSNKYESETKTTVGNSELIRKEQQRIDNIKRETPYNYKYLLKSPESIEEERMRLTEKLSKQEAGVQEYRNIARRYFKECIT